MSSKGSSSLPAIRKAEVQKPIVGRFGTTEDDQNVVKQLLKNLHSIARLMAESLCWGDPANPSLQRVLVNSLRLAYRYGGETAEDAMVAEINSYMLSGLWLERDNTSPPISEGTTYQRIYILKDRQSGRSAPLAMFELDRQEPLSKSIHFDTQDTGN
jgi:hypothetical protein